jgi:hypothetical protein
MPCNVPYIDHAPALRSKEQITPGR